MAFLHSTSKEGRALYPISFMTCMLAVGLTHASSLHAPHNQCLHSFFLSFSFLLFRCFSPSFCSSSFWFCSLHFLMPLYLSWFFCSRFSLSCSFSVVYLTHFCFLYSLLSFCFFFCYKPPMHLTVQTEGSDGVAAQTRSWRGARDSPPASHHRPTPQS